MKTQVLVSSFVQSRASGDENVLFQACAASGDERDIFCSNPTELCIRPRRHYSPYNNGNLTKGPDSVSGCKPCGTQYLLQSLGFMSLCGSDSPNERNPHKITRQSKFSISGSSEMISSQNQIVWGAVRTGGKGLISLGRLWFTWDNREHMAGWRDADGGGGGGGTRKKCICCGVFGAYR